MLVPFSVPFSVLALSFLVAGERLFPRQGYGYGGSPNDDADDDVDDSNSVPTTTTSAPVSNPTSGGSNAVTLTGGQICNTAMCVAATKNGSQVSYVLSSTGSQTPGWMAVGFGQRMSGTEMFILWSNSDGSITLSQRTASGQFEPAFNPTPARVATLANDLSATSGDIKYAFTLPADSTASQNLIYAFGTTNPRSSSPDATLQQHSVFNTGSINLNAPISGGNTGSGGGSTESPLLSHERLFIAHGLLCTIGFLLLLPIGALLARYMRTYSSKWFLGHSFIQFWLSGPVIVVGIALGIAAVSQAGGTHLNDSHKKWGIALLVLYLLQCGSGAFIHWVKPKVSRGRPAQNYFHAVIGLLIIGLAFYQVRTGFRAEWPSTTGRGALPNGVNIIWYVWVVLLPLLYAVGLALLPRQFKQEAASRSKGPSGAYSTVGAESHNMGNMQHRYHD